MFSSTFCNIVVAWREAEQQETGLGSPPLSFCSSGFLGSKLVTGS